MCAAVAAAEKDARDLLQRWSKLHSVRALLASTASCWACLACTGRHLLTCHMSPPLLLLLQVRTALAGFAFGSTLCGVLLLNKKN